MKKIITILIICTIGLMSQSCDKWLNLEPETSMIIKDGEESIKFLNEVSGYLNGTYSLMRSEYYYGSRMTYYGDVTAEDLQAQSNTKRSSNFYAFRFNKDNVPNTFWSTCYTIISQANLILNEIDNVQVDSVNNITLLNYKGQALTIRALAYFDLTRLYGYPYTKDNGASLSVPIIKTPVSKDYKPKRNTVAECYDFIIEDLVAAVGTLDGATNPKGIMQTAKNDGKFNRWAAMALLSRVYLYKGDDANALKYAEAAISGAEKAKYALWTAEEFASAATSWAVEYPGEALFELLYNATENEGNNTVGYLYYRAGYDDIIMSDNFIDFISLDKSDVRYKLIINESKYSGRRYLWKYPANPTDGGSGRRQYSNIKVLRLTETYLIAAEAAVKTGDNAKAVKYLEPIVKRGNVDNTVAGTTVTLDRVLDERRKELIGEGHRMFDMMRNNKTITRKPKPNSSHLDYVLSDAWTFDWNFYRIVLAIPKVERDANENLNTPDQQNPGY